MHRRARAPLPRLAGQAAARIHRRHGLARGRLRPQRASTATGHHGNAVLSRFPDRRPGEPGHLRARVREPGHAALRDASRGAAHARAALHQRAPRAVRARPALAGACAVRADPRRRADGRAADHRRRLQRLAAQGRPHAAGGARRRRGVRGRARARRRAPSLRCCRCSASTGSMRAACALPRRRSTTPIRWRGSPTTRRWPPLSSSSAAPMAQGADTLNRFVPGNRIALLRNGAEYFPALERAIDGAQREVWLETYIFADDPAGRSDRRGAGARGAARRGGAPAGRRLGRQVLPDRRARALAARRGRRAAQVPARGRAVAVPLASPAAPAPQALPRRRPHRVRRRHQRHRRHEHAGHEAAARRLRGQRRGARCCPRSCRRCSGCGQSSSWCSSATASCRSFRSRCAADASGKQTAKFVIRDNLRHRRDIEHAYLAAIRGAKREIMIANSYFFPGHPFPPRAGRSRRSVASR